MKLNRLQRKLSEQLRKPRAVSLLVRPRLLQQRVKVAKTQVCPTLRLSNLRCLK